MSLKERLKIFIEHSNLSVSAFERSISASTGYVKNISKTIGAEKLDAIEEKYPHLNLSWLTRGEGEMLKYHSVNEESTEYNITETAGIRLAEYAEQKNLSIKDFGIKCDIGYNNTASLLKGSLPLGMQVLHKIKKAFPYINTEWILFGNGEMEINTSPTRIENSKEVEQLEQINYLLTNTIKDKEKTISSLENQIALMEKLQEATKTEESPVKSNVARQ